MAQMGRPKGSLNKAQMEVRALAKEYGPEAIKRLAEIMREGEDADAIKAANALLDRAYGKAVAHVELTGEDGGPLEIMTPSVIELVAPMLKGHDDSKA